MKTTRRTTQLTPKQESQAVLSDAAAQLGVSPERLTNALEQALKNRVDAAVADGRLTQQQADELKSRIDAGELPLFGLRGGHLFRHHGLEEAANELDEAVAGGRLTRAQADELLADLRAHATDRVTGVRSEFRGGFRFGGPRV